MAMLIDGCIFLNLSKSIESVAGLKLWSLLKSPTIYSYYASVHLPFCNYINEYFEIVTVQVNGPLPKRGGGEQTGVPGENPWVNKPENRYHIFQVKIHRPNRESNPRPLALVISSLGQNSPALTKWTTGCHYNMAMILFHSPTLTFRLQVCNRTEHATEWLRYTRV